MANLTKKPLPCLLCLLLTYSGCLPMGLPEYVAHIPVKHSRIAGVGAPTALIIQDTFGSRLSNPETLGHQYIFGFIPATSLYAQHGLDAALTELLLDVLTQQGYQT